MPQASASASSHLLSRRRVALAIPLLGSALWAATAKASTPVLRTQRPVVGTAVDIVVEGADAQQLRSATEHAFARMRELEALLSKYDPQSPVSRVSAAAGKHPVAVPPAVMAVLREAQRIHAVTDGAFDVTVGGLKAWHFGEGVQQMPQAEEVARQLSLVGAQDLVLDTNAGTAFLRRRGMALDLGGIAKLPILEAGMRVLQEHGIDNAMVNGGGDVLVRGQIQGRAWRVGLRDPRTPSQLLGAVSLQGSAVVASSGDYERYFLHQGQRQHHVLNPRTGRPSSGVHGVSLVARDVAAVNGLGAALMVQGPQAGRALAQRVPGLAVLVAGRTAACGSPLPWRRCWSRWRLDVLTLLRLSRAPGPARSAPAAVLGRPEWRRTARRSGSRPTRSRCPAPADRCG